MECKHTYFNKYHLISVGLKPHVLDWCVYCGAIRKFEGTKIILDWMKPEKDQKYSGR